jgi:putative oxidoreductase
MNNLIPNRVASIIYALVIGYFGVTHLMHAKDIGGAVPTYMPGDGSIWIYVTGAALVAAALAIIINKFARIACYLLALMLLIFVFAIHLKMVTDSEGMMQTQALGGMLKDVGLAMAAILIGNNSPNK